MYIFVILSALQLNFHSDWIILRFQPVYISASSAGFIVLFETTSGMGRDRTGHSQCDRYNGNCLRRRLHCIY